MMLFFKSGFGRWVGGALLSTLFSLGLVAQPQEAPVVEFSFQTYYIGSASELVEMPELYFESGDRFLPLPLRAHALGLKRMFKGVAPFAVYVKDTNPAGELFYRRVAILEQTFSAGRQLAQVIFFKAESGRLLLNAVAVGEDLESGKILVLNAGLRDITVKAGATDPVRIDGGATRLIDYKYGEDHRFRLMVASENEEAGWELIHNAVVTQVREQPLMLVVYPHAKAKRTYNVRFIRLNH